MILSSLRIATVYSYVANTRGALIIKRVEIFPSTINGGLNKSQETLLNHLKYQKAQN